MFAAVAKGLSFHLLLPLPEADPNALQAQKRSVKRNVPITHSKADAKTRKVDYEAFEVR